MSESQESDVNGGYQDQYDDPLFLSNSDYPSMKLVNSLFNGNNFLNWSRGVVMALGTKNKQGFLDGSTAMPGLTSSTFQKWFRADHMVRCWILNALAPEIKQGFMSANWDDIEDLEMFPDCTHGVLAKCSCSFLKKILEIVTREKVMTFLMGLDSEYEHLKTNIMSMDPLRPNLTKAYSLVQQIERQKRLSRSAHDHAESSAMAVNRKPF
ncbi:uncharacterized protein LOC141620861 [Silene latifolia]|uniref:uncharacterized protein LOC141620861 n=1 Tax=Silene latifolia TaxID=37657 RepID=UPI003D7709C8